MLFAIVIAVLSVREGSLSRQHIWMFRCLLVGRSVFAYGRIGRLPRGTYLGISQVRGMTSDVVFIDSSVDRFVQACKVVF